MASTPCLPRQPGGGRCESEYPGLSSFPPVTQADL